MSLRSASLHARPCTPSDIQVSIPFFCICKPSSEHVISCRCLRGGASDTGYVRIAQGEKPEKLLIRTGDLGKLQGSRPGWRCGLPAAVRETGGGMVAWLGERGCQGSIRWLR